jgi:hypothetical protein
MMTAKLRTQIELQDIIGLEYERFERRTTQCPNCRVEWLEGSTPIGSEVTL